MTTNEMAGSSKRIDYHKEFLKGHFHMVFAICSLGAGLVSGNILGLGLGVIVYVIGLINLPLLPLFRREYDKRQKVIEDAENQRKFEAFKLKMNDLLSGLEQEALVKYSEVAKICSTISAQDKNQTRKLQEIMWALLKLMTVEQSIRRMLDADKEDPLEDAVTRLQAEIAKEDAALKGLIGTGVSPSVIQSKDRLLSSKNERLAVLKQRLEKTKLTSDNLQVLKTEQDRLVEQVKLMQITAFSATDMSDISSRIDATLSGLDSVSSMLKGLGQEPTQVFDVNLPQFTPDSLEDFGSKNGNALTQPTKVAWEGYNNDDYRINISTGRKPKTKAKILQSGRYN